MARLTATAKAFLQTAPLAIDGRTPRHVAIIMDGNGRWAQARHRPRTMGHQAGLKAVRAAVEHSRKRGVEALTLFAFSSENWQRPEGEVKRLMELFLKAIEREVDQLLANGVRLRFVGDLSAFDTELRAAMDAAAARTTVNSALTLNVAVNYGGRWDIAQAARALAEAVKRGELDATQIDEQRISQACALSDLPPPDLFIRTGGDQRISNFLLWQLAYTELYFSDVLWPDFSGEEYDRALAEFARRERRFGKTSAQVQTAC
jgi:undecaprenyl diphosphate synthase